MNVMTSKCAKCGLRTKNQNKHVWAWTEDGWRIHSARFCMVTQLANCHLTIAALAASCDEYRRSEAAKEKQSPAAALIEAAEEVEDNRGK